MNLSVKPGVRNIKNRSTARTQKVSHKRLTVQDVKKDKEAERLNQKVFPKNYGRFT